LGRSIHYLGVYLVNTRCKLSFSFIRCKHNFYASFISIKSHARSLEQLTQLSLVESHCLPLLTYATGAVIFTISQMQELNVCWNTVYRTIFGFNRWESVKQLIFGLGIPNLLRIIKLYRIRFIFHLLNLNQKIL